MIHDSYQTLTVERIEAGILLVSLNRPERRNAINVQMMLDLEAAFCDAQADESIRVVLLGAHGDSFCSGHDLDRSTPLDAQWEARRSTSEGRLLVEEELYYRKSLFLRNFPKPTIAVVQGPAVAAGWALASVCDLILAATSARFQNPMCKMATAGSFLFVEPWDLNVRKAKELLFTADWLSAEDAHRYGMVNQVYDQTELLDQSVKLAARIASMPPWALRLVKRSCNLTLDRMGQRDSWEQQFMVRQLGHASTERQNVLERLRSGGSVRSFLRERDGE